MPPVLLPLLTFAAAVLSSHSFASEVRWADPLPNSANSGGLSYEWSITMSTIDRAEFFGTVGARSSYDPSFAAPEFANTHASHWVALEFSATTSAMITISRQANLPLAVLNTTTTPASLMMTGAGNALYPVVSVYKNWEENSQEGNFSNPIGRANWQKDLEFIGLAYADGGASSIIYKGTLPKGRYTLNIGGAAAWPTNGCASSNSACYNGEHGYHATIVTGFDQL